MPDQVRARDVVVAPDLGEWLNKHGTEETEPSITGKLARGAFAVSFFLAVLTVLDLEGVRLEDL